MKKKEKINHSIHETLTQLYTCFLCIFFFVFSSKPKKTHTKNTPHIYMYFHSSRPTELLIKIHSYMIQLYTIKIISYSYIKKIKSDEYSEIYFYYCQLN